MLNEVNEMEQIIQQLTVTQKRNIIKNSNLLTEMFKNKVNKPLSKAKGEDIDSFINELGKEEKKIIVELSYAESENSDDAKQKLKNKNSGKKESNEEVGELTSDVEEKNDSHSTELLPDNDSSSNTSSVTSESQPQSEKPERDIPEEILRKIFRDLYPTNIHKTKYIQENPSLKMSALTKGIFAKNAKKEDIDDFLVKQVPKTPKSMKQLSIDWLESKKNLKLDPQKLTSDSLTIEDVRNILSDVNLEELETYSYLMQAEVNDKLFDFIKLIKEEETKKKHESGSFDSEKIKTLESKIKELEGKLFETEEKQKEEINNYRQNYEIEKDKLKTKYEQRLETMKTKYDEEKTQLVKIQADSDRRFSEERKTFSEQIDVLEKENKKLVERINNIGYDLMNQNKQNKDASKSLTRTQNRIEELLVDNKELTTRNEELKANNELLSSQVMKLRKQENSYQEKIQELTIKIQELEKMKVAFLLNGSELQSVIKELNAVDESKERMLQLLNIDTRHTRDNEERIQSLDELWVALIGQEEDIIADYLSVGTEEVATKDFLKEKIDSLLDLEYNLKAREVLVKVLYEKGYKAYQNLQ